jgi:hypothetical protein
MTTPPREPIRTGLTADTLRRAVLEEIWKISPVRIGLD